MKSPAASPYTHDPWIFVRNAFIGISLLLLLMVSTAQGQSEYVEYYGQNLRINNIGMAVLGSWALANISIGAYGWSQKHGAKGLFPSDEPILEYRESDHRRHCAV
jgi:hypothetical protein